MQLLNHTLTAEQITNGLQVIYELKTPISDTCFSIKNNFRHLLGKFSST